MSKNKSKSDRVSIATEYFLFEFGEMFSVDKSVTSEVNVSFKPVEFFEDRGAVSNFDRCFGQFGHIVGTASDFNRF